MAVGAPDHIRLADDAHSRYTWKWELAASIMANDATLYTLIDTDFEGVLISFSSTCKYTDTRYRIYVDDVETQELRPIVLWQSHRFRQPPQGFDITGVQIYDEINDLYGVWFYTHFKCYVKKNVKVDVYQNSGGVIQILYPMIYYLER